MPSTDGVLDVDARTWATPLSGLKLEHGNARLRPTTYTRGYYHMEGIEGHELYKVTGGRLPVQQLQRQERGRWKTWMVDDPLHWYGMRERVMALPAGKVLVAGLGLGLFAHHLLERPDITYIEVVELDPDVVQLIGPTLPRSLPLQVTVGDYYQRIGELATQGPYGRPDGILWDLAVGGPQDTRHDFRKAAILTTIALPGVPLSCFGLRDGASTIFGDLS